MSTGRLTLLIPLHLPTPAPSCSLLQTPLRLTQLQVSKMMFDSEAYMSGAIPSGSWVPGQANGTSLSDRESAAGQPMPSTGGLHVNPLIGRGAAEINSGMGMGMGGMMNPLMMGRMAAFGGGGMGGAAMGRGGGGMGARTKSQPNLYIPTTHTRSQLSTGSPTPSQSPSQVHAHGHSLAHRQMSANTVPRSPLAKSYVAPSRGEEDGYFRPSHRSPLSPAATGKHNPSTLSASASREIPRGRMSRSVPTTPVYDGWAQEAVTRSAHAAVLPAVAPTEASSSGMSYDPPSSSSGSALAINYPGSQERAVLRHARGRSRSHSRTPSRSRPRERAHSGNITDPDDWESHSGAPRNISPEAVYTKIQVPIRDKADSLPAPQATSSKFYDDRRSRSHQPRAPTALRSESSRSVNKVVRIDSIPEGRPAQTLQAPELGDSVPLPLARTPRPGIPRRHTSQTPQSPLPSAGADVQVPMPSPSPLPSAHGGGRRSHIPRSMSHDTLDMYGLADDLPPLSPLAPRSRSRAAGGASQSPGSVYDPAGSRRTGYVAPLVDDEYDRYTAHPAAASPSTPVYASQGGAGQSVSGSMYAETRGSRGRSPIVAPSQYGGSVNAAQAMMPSASMSTMTVSPQTPADKPLMTSDYLTPGFPKPTRPIAWNRDGPTMKSPGIAWHRDVAPDAPLSPAPSGPSWQQAAPPNYGPILPDRASSHGSGWWEAASRV